ncbi:MAG: DUF4189 domain-containing protein [Stenotrophomonas indicatrix]
MECVMRRISVLAVSLVSLALSASAFAEGNCPSGYYPIGGQGVQGCAPIPGGSSGGGPAQGGVPQPPRPSGEWLTRWGAVVQSPTSDLIGTSANKTSEAAAETEARRICESEGARDCKTSLTYYNQCVAFSVPNSGKGRGSVNTAVDLATAKKNALASCNDAGGGRCVISHTECSEPVFREY